ncbi:MAG: NAD(P)H-hydrate epimerase, partial [Planctomycetota bacterium]
MSPESRSLSRRQVRDVDRRAIEQWGVPGVVLMENAGRGAADAIEEFLGGVEGTSGAVVAGGGNNGGDGFVIARHLTLRGATCVVFLVADPESLRGDAATNYAVLPHVNVEVRRVTGDRVASLSASLAGFGLVVDAVGGTGISGPLRGDAAAVVGQINAAGRPVVAVDSPTGLDCDTGEAP